MIISVLKDRNASAEVREQRGIGALRDHCKPERHLRLNSERGQTGEHCGRPGRVVVAPPEIDDASSISPARQLVSKRLPRGSHDECSGIRWAFNRIVCSVSAAAVKGTRTSRVSASRISIIAL